MCGVDSCIFDKRDRQKRRIHTAHLKKTGQGTSRVSLPQNRIWFLLPSPGRTDFRHVQVRGSLTQAAQQHEEGSEGASSGQGAATGGRGTGADPCLVQGQGGVLGGVRAMGDAAGDPGGGHGVYHQHLKQDVDDRSISAPPVLELTAKVMAGAC